MAREIKFRFWDNIKKDYQKDGSVLLGSAGEPFSLVPSTGGYIVQIRNCTVEQFTGLKDKNGVDIYDGDILECLAEIQNYDDDDICNPRNHFMPQYSQKRFKREVFFSNGGFNTPTPNCIVIGNIHQNPELLHVNN